jgi:ankyrin repeat protein
MTPTEKIIAAAKRNDLETVRKIFREHPEIKSHINEPSPGGCFGATPLLQAVQLKNKGLIDVLLENGADINGRSHWWAGSFGVLDSDSGLETFLIERGAVVDAHAAARLGMMDRLKELVEANPQVVHARGGDGQTPLHFASSIEVADFLLDHGADINALDVDHESTPAQWMLGRRTELARHLVNRGCRTDLLMAAALGDLERVRKHLAADPNCIRMSVSPEWFPMKDPRAGGSIYIWTLGQNKTAPMVARDFGHEDVARFLEDICEE